MINSKLDINFPITFYSLQGKDNPRGVTFYHPSNGRWNHGEYCNLPLKHFIDRHNSLNPENNRVKDYFFEENINIMRDMHDNGNVRYPIAFHCESGDVLFFPKQGKPGYWADRKDRLESSITIEEAVRMHKDRNPNNEPDKNFFVELVAFCNDDIIASLLQGYRGEDDPEDEPDTMASVFNGVVKAGTMVLADAVITSGIRTAQSSRCKIEHMPIGATLTGIQDEEGDMIPMRFKPAKIETATKADDYFTLLLHCGVKRGTFSGELNIKVGTVVDYEI